MNDLAQLAGFLASEAILHAAKGKVLPPLIIFEHSSGRSQVIQIDEPTPETAALKGAKMITENLAGALRGVMAFDAYLNLPQGRKDAIFLQGQQFTPVAGKIFLAVPYRHRNKPGGFAVHRPKYFAYEDEPLPEAEVIAAFFRGTELHEIGGKFWREHQDDSY